MNAAFSPNAIEGNADFLPDGTSTPAVALLEMLTGDTGGEDEVDNFLRRVKGTSGNPNLCNAKIYLPNLYRIISIFLSEF